MNQRYAFPDENKSDEADKPEFELELETDEKKT